MIRPLPNYDTDHCQFYGQAEISSGDLSLAKTWIWARPGTLWSPTKLAAVSCQALSPLSSQTGLVKLFDIDGAADMSQHERKSPTEVLYVPA